MHLAPRLFTLLWLVALSACSGPTAGNDESRSGGKTAAARDADGQGEQLLAQPPDGWKQASATKTPALRIAEFIPADDSADDWSEKVTFESLSGAPLPDPIEFVTGIGEHQSVACDQFHHVNIESGQENNYPTSVRLLTCVRNKLTNKGEVSLIKAIKGDDYFYVITRAKRVPPIGEDEQPLSEQEMAVWSLFMRGIKVCNPTREQHPCISLGDASEGEPPSANRSGLKTPPTTDPS